MPRDDTYIIEQKFTSHTQPSTKFHNQPPLISLPTTYTTPQPTSQRTSPTRPSNNQTPSSTFQYTQQPDFLDRIACFKSILFPSKTLTDVLFIFLKFFLLQVTLPYASTYIAILHMTLFRSARESRPGRRVYARHIYNSRFDYLICPTCRRQLVYVCELR